MNKLFGLFSIMGAVAFIIAGILVVKVNRLSSGPDQRPAIVQPRDDATPDAGAGSHTDSASSPAHSDDYLRLSSKFDELSKKHRILKNNIIALKARLAALESRIAYLDQNNTASAGKAKNRLEDTDFATQRRKAALERDAGRYPPGVLKKLEEQYGKAMKKIKTPEGQKALLDLYDKYPDSNRGGCAAMNLATELAADGKTDASAALLDRLIDNESQSVFGNGVAILPKALFARAKMAKKENDEESFDNIKQTIQESFPNEIDNNGKTFSSMLNQMGQQK